MIKEQIPFDPKTLDGSDQAFSRGQYNYSKLPLSAYRLLQAYVSQSREQLFKPQDGNIN